MPGPDAAIEVAQAPVLEPVNQAVHADIGSTVEQVVLRSACPVDSVTRPEAR